eukprot:CAMPEP_0175138392 /NCGR_PEP_ID=MMETSP0087-20121206/10326_1 /TAXON_ID=136419 /ORGANISM="Unknown Unknown, Strain D1" /LENGTH=299 /DNA_ID=CAMNT_0016421295 /DNA_START=134 /DNA_END=1033 /DNA_ORIENTATION=-
MVVGSVGGSLGSLLFTRVEFRGVVEWRLMGDFARLGWGRILRYVLALLMLSSEFCGLLYPSFFFERKLQILQCFLLAVFWAMHLPLMDRAIMCATIKQFDTIFLTANAVAWQVADCYVKMQVYAYYGVVDGAADFMFHVFSSFFVFVLDTLTVDEKSLTRKVFLLIYVLACIFQLYFLSVPVSLERDPELDKKYCYLQDGSKCFQLRNVERSALVNVFIFSLKVLLKVVRGGNPLGIARLPLDVQVLLEEETASSGGDGQIGGVDSGRPAKAAALSNLELYDRDKPEDQDNRPVAEPPV